VTQVRVVTDSAADLPAEVVTRLAITVVPLVVRFGRETFLDGQLSSEEFWQKVDQGPHHPGTSQPSVGVFEEAFGHLVDAGHTVLCLTITGRHSGTFASASAAAVRFGDQVRVIDTLSLSIGQGFQVLAAARAAMRGMDLDRVAGLAERVRRRTHLYILLDTIEHLRRGGRADVLMPVLSRVARTLRIRPVLDIVDGQLSLHSLTRTYGRGLARIRREIAQLQPVESLAVIHVCCPEPAQDTARALAEELSYPLKDIVVRETGAVLSSHAGPRVVGVAAVQQSG